MINGTINEFLASGWYSEASLFYKGYLYWFEANTDSETNITEFWVNRWKAMMDKEKMVFHSIIEKNDKLSGFSTVLTICGTDMAKIRQQLLTSPIFDGKTFWQVEKELAWLEEGRPVQAEQLSKERLKE